LNRFVTFPSENPYKIQKWDSVGAKFDFYDVRKEITFYDYM